MKITFPNLVASGVIIVIGFLCVLIIAPYVGIDFISNGSFVSDYLTFFNRIVQVEKIGMDVSGEIGTNGDAFGVLNPFIAIVAALLTFLAFWVQFNANQKIESRDEEQKIVDMFAEHHQMLMSIKLYDREHGAYDFNYATLEDAKGDLGKHNHAKTVVVKYETVMREGVESLYFVLKKKIFASVLCAASNFNGLANEGKYKTLKECYNSVLRERGYLFLHYHKHALAILDCISKSSFRKKRKIELGRRFVSMLSSAEKILLFCYSEFGSELAFDEDEKCDIQQTLCMFGCFDNIELLSMPHEKEFGCIEFILGLSTGVKGKYSY